jgi:hypothetical protein
MRRVSLLSRLASVAGRLRKQFIVYRPVTFSCREWSVGLDGNILEKIDTV